MSDLDALFSDWVDEARAVTVQDEIDRRGIRLRRAGTEMVGPCPVCGGTDRFGVNIRRNLWNCRKAARGGDAIALVQYLDGADFLGACETLTGRPPPRGEGTRASPEELAAREEERRAKATQKAATADHFREQERKRLFEMWCRAQRGAAPVTDYYAARGILLPPAFVGRFLASCPYYHGVDDKGRWRVVHRGPAKLLPITDALGLFRGLHFTWLDPKGPKGKAEVIDPDTGEILSAKKIRGSKQGRRILLVPAEVPPRRQVAGEGSETVLSVYTADVTLGRRRPETEYVSSADLGNLAGEAEDRVRHPTMTRTDKLGRVFPVLVPGAVPNPASAAMWVPDEIAHLTLLGDGDSDPFITDLAMRRAEARHAAPGRTVTTAWAPPGKDFNSLLMGRAA